MRNIYIVFFYNNFANSKDTLVVYAYKRVYPSNNNLVLNEVILVAVVTSV